MKLFCEPCQVSGIVFFDRQDARLKSILWMMRVFGILCLLMIFNKFAGESNGVLSMKSRSR